MRPSCPSLARAVVSALLAAACTQDRSITGVATEPAGPLPARPLADVATPVAASVTGVAYVVNTTQDLKDPDVGTSLDDGRCDDAPGLTVGTLCSLRAALQNHDKVPNATSTITFSLGPGVPTIHLEFQLPDVGGTVTIDGATGGATRVELDGTAANAYCCKIGLKLTGTGSQIRNLVLNRFAGTAIWIQVANPAGSQHLIDNNYIGTDAAGTAALSPSGRGIEISMLASGGTAGGNVISNNVIGGNTDRGIYVSGSRGNVIKGNRIGLGADGLTTVPNAPYGMEIRGVRTVVGGPLAADANVVVASQGPLADRYGGTGVFVRAGGDSSRVEGNFVGTTAAGRVLPNGGQGVAVENAGGVAVTRNWVFGNLRGGVAVIGTTATGLVAGTSITSNYVRDNRYYGVEISGNDVTVSGNSITGTVQADNYGGTAGGGGVAIVGGTRNRVRGNAISGNAALGIDLWRDGVTTNDAGDADGATNYPVLTAASVSAAGTAVVGTLDARPSTAYVVDVYASAACDPSGYGEGQTYLGAFSVTTDATGRAALGATVTTRAAGGSAITATATDPAGTTSELSACRLLPPNRPPVVTTAGGPYAGSEGVPIAFTSAGASDPDSDPLTYLWDFGDGTTSTAASPSHAYAASRATPYAVTLTVKDPAGLAATVTTTATVANVAPTVDLQAPAGPLSASTPLSFPHVVSDPGGATDAPWTVVITWGDGQKDSLSTATLLGGPACPTYCKTHTYAVPGTYTAQMSVRDKDGGVGTDAVTVTVVKLDRPPVPKPNGPYTGTEGAAVAFSSAGSSDPDGDPITYLWDFGDGTTSTAANPSHVYAASRATPYTVTLTVKDPAGNTGSATTTAAIANAVPVVVTSTSATSFVAGGSLSVQWQFTDAGTADAPWQYAVDWGDGTAASTGSLTTQGTANTHGHTYATPGTYTARVRVTDKDGGTGTSAPITVTVAPNVWAGWDAVGSTFTSAPVAASWGPGRYDVFVRAGTTLWHRAWAGSWAPWEPLDGEITSDPAVVSWAPGRYDLFARGTDAALWHRVYLNGTWGPWESLGGALVGTPAVASWAPGRLDVFIRGTDNALWHIAWGDSFGWSPWESQGGALSADPAVISYGVGRLDVFIRGTDGALWYKWFQGTWSGWTSFGGALAGAPVVTSWGSGRLDVFMRGTDNGLWHIAWQGSYGWSGWEAQGGSLTSDPVAVARGLSIQVYARGADNSLQAKSFASGAWQPWVSKGGLLGSRPTAVWSATDGGGPDVLVLGTTGTVWHRR